MQHYEVISLLLFTNIYFVIIIFYNLYYNTNQYNIELRKNRI